MPSLDPVRHWTVRCPVVSVASGPENSCRIQRQRDGPRANRPRVKRGEPKSLRREQCLSLPPNPAHEIGGGLCRSESRRLASPCLHTVYVAGFRSCIAHGLRQRSLYRVGCRLRRLRGVRSFHIPRSNAAPKPARKGSRRRGVLGLSRTDGVGPCGR